MKVRVKSGAVSVPVWFRENAELGVLALQISPVNGVGLILWSDLQESAGIFPGVDFHVTDSALPGTWVIDYDSSGFISIAPKPWQGETFWDLYNDADPAATEIFSLEMEKIINE